MVRCSLCALFANDTLAYTCNCKPRNAPCCALQSDANMIHDWSLNWNTIFNATKSQHMIIAGRRQECVTDFHLSIDGKEILPVSDTKHLGVHLSLLYKTLVRSCLEYAVLCGMIALQKVPAPWRKLNFPVPVLFCPTAKKQELIFTAISPLYKLIWPLHARIRGKWAESVSTHLKNGAIVRSLGDMGTKWRRRFARISSFPTRVNSSKSAKR